MSGPAWFVPHSAEKHTIRYPGAELEAARRRKDGVPDDQVDAFLAEHTAWVEVRALSAGDRAELDEMKFDDKGEGRLSFGEMKIKTVVACLVNWSLPLPVSEQSIRDLSVGVFEAIFAAVPDGMFIVGESGGANGSGPPPPAPMEAPAQAKEAEAVEP